MSRFTIADLPLAGLKLVERKQIGDNRGFLSRLFCGQELAEAGWHKPIAQINHTYTARRGTVRGMHYQRPPYAEMKLVSCLQGEILDIAVDLRAGSPTFLKWHAELLSARNNRALLIPEGFAHGFQTMTSDVTLLYCHSNEYSHDSEGALNVLDPKLAIEWPLDIAELSFRDKNHPMLASDFSGVSF